jgi:phosphoglycerate dehydrogenase-like enzyme
MSSSSAIIPSVTSFAVQTAAAVSMKRLNILITGDVPDWVRAKLIEQGHKVHSVSHNAYVEPETFAKGIKGFDVYVSGGDEACTANVINSADCLKSIIFLGADYKSHIDEEAALKRGVSVYNTPGANARAVAEHTFMLIKLAARDGASMLKSVRDCKWDVFIGSELEGKTIGLIGAGAIAAKVAKIALGYDMKVVYWNRSGAKQDMGGEYGEYKDQIDDVLKGSDIISLHVPLAAGEIIGERELGLMKPHASLINTARARLVNADALYNTLKNNKIHSAAFDVFYKEGPDFFDCPEGKLLELGSDKFILTPHAAWKTREADDRMFQMALSHIDKIVQHNTP